ncbi:MAG: hypothetical protein A4E71_01162 [Smithella sp. PtaU1.Bin162]|nr:MAG: hypothetical protein A4E71_01162 [Smithella sp. PtaU1.Bin162]
MKKKPPDNPLHKGNRQEYADNRKCCRHNGKTYFRRGKSSRLPRRHTILHMPVNIFNDNYRVIDQQSHGKRQRQHRHIVESKTEGADECKSRYYGNRQGNGADQCCPHIFEENKDRQYCKDTADNQMELHLMNGTENEQRLVHGNIDSHSRRQSLVDAFHFFFYPVRHHNRICPRLFLNTKTDGGNTIETYNRSFFFHTVFSSADITDTNRCTFVVTDD